VGVCYLLLVRDNGPKEIARLLAAQGLAVHTVLQRRARNELLLVLRICSPPPGGDGGGDGDGDGDGSGSGAAPPS
jgi:hypothetical protein